MSIRSDGRLSVRLTGVALVLITSVPFVILVTLLGSNNPLLVIALTVGWFATLFVSLSITLRADQEIRKHAETSQKFRRSVDSAHSFVLDSMIELRRPLQGLVGVKDLYGVDTNPENKEYMDVVDHCTNHMLNQLERLQFFAEMSLHNIPKKEKSFDIRELTSTAIQSVTSRLVGRSASIVKSIEKNIPEKAKGPAAWVEPLIVETIDCCLRASGSGKMLLSISRDKLAPHQLIFTLRDEVGFSDKTLREIEREVSSPKNSTPWSGKSLGLGVPILRTLLNALGGRFWVQGDTSETMSAHVSLPLVMDPMIQSEIPLDARDVEVHHHLASNQILVVDDEPLVRNLLSSLLHRLGQDVTVATNGHEAVELCRRHLFGIVFMDMDMPIMDGWTAADTILQKLHLPHPPKIIAVSSHTREQDRQRGLSAGMYAYLNKPAGTKDLKSILEGLGLNTTPKSESKLKAAEEELASAYSVDFNRMYQFYSEDFKLCTKVLVQAQISLPEMGMQIEKAVIAKEERAVKHALHQIKGEFAICMCAPGVTLVERMMAYDQSSSADFLSDFEEMNQLIERVIREIDELTQNQGLAA